MYSGPRAKSIAARCTGKRSGRARAAGSGRRGAIIRTHFADRVNDHDTYSAGGSGKNPAGGSASHTQLYIDRIHVQPKRREDNQMVERRIREILGRKYRFDPKDDYALGVWNTIEQAEVAGKAFRGIEIFLGLIGGLTLLIGAVGVTNLMYALVKERTREIGIKMALGARRRHIILQFLLETVFIFSKGTFWGTVEYKKCEIRR